MEDGVCGLLDHIIAMSMGLGHWFKCLRGKTTGRTGVSYYLWSDVRGSCAWGTVPLLTHIAAREKGSRFGRGGHRTRRVWDQGKSWIPGLENLNLVEQLANFSKFG